MPTARTSSSSIVLITGCSSGIGRAAAQRLAARGHTVYATARREESVRELADWAASAGSARARALDVTQPDAIAAVVTEILDAEGRIDALINNAGYGQFGAVEDISLDAWRRQMETNLIGAVALTQACLPAMRRQQAGRIINVSSVVAHIAAPLMGPYAASKHALDAFSQSLRNEVARWGIRVVLIEPGPIATRFREHLQAYLERENVGASSPYAGQYRALDAYWSSRFGKQGKTADDVAELVVRAVEARRPRRRYRITGVAHLIPRLRPMVPDWLFDALVRRRLADRDGA